MTTPLYRALLLAIERRRLKLGWPMWYLDDRAGSQDRYYSKCLYSETDSGRMARWDTLQLFIDALWPDGAGLRIMGEPIPDDETLRAKIAEMQKPYIRTLKKRARTPSHLRVYATGREAHP